VIELVHVTKTYGSRVAVCDLSLTVSAGELFAFLGPNGAGKTTTIKMLVGLLRPTRGEVRIGGQNVQADHRRASQMVGYVPDQPCLYDKLSGRELLEFVAGLRGLHGEVGAAAVQAQIEAFELGEFIDDLAESYSHGMKQRLVFAAALLHDPPVLVIDEPMVGLDPRSARLVKDLLRARTRRGACVFLSTHLLDMAEELADRVAIVDRGRLCCCGTVAELREQFVREHTSLEQMFLHITAGSADINGAAAPGASSPRNSGSQPLGRATSSDAGLPPPMRDAAP
jgi:ABC-2 type transport system ATP-binding protein